MYTGVFFQTNGFYQCNEILLYMFMRFKSIFINFCHRRVFRSNLFRNNKSYCLRFFRITTTFLGINAMPNNIMVLKLPSQSSWNAEPQRTASRRYSVPSTTWRRGNRSDQEKSRGGARTDTRIMGLSIRVGGFSGKEGPSI